MSLFSKNKDRHTVLSYRWVQEQDRNWLERIEDRFESFEEALEFVLSREFSAKIFDMFGELIHEHDHHHHKHHHHHDDDDGYCY